MSLSVCVLVVTVDFDLVAIVTFVAISVVDVNMLLVGGLLVVNGRVMPVDAELASIVALLVSFVVDVDMSLVVSVKDEAADIVDLVVSSVDTGTSVVDAV